MPVRRYGRYRVETSSEDKVLFPGRGRARGTRGTTQPITKADLLDYYERAWERMRPHLADRPLVLERFPEGIAGEGFYQKQVPDHFPDWMARVRVPKREGGRQELVVCDSKAALVFLGNQAAVTLHPWLSRTDRLDVPDQLVVDLDPPGPGFAPVRRAALQCRAVLDELDLFSVIKTTGSRGVHVVVPLRREEGSDAVRAFARRLAERLAARHPKELTTEQRKAKRQGRLYLDVARNAYAQTAVAPWAMRALPGAPVATPIDWSELDDRRLDAQSFHLGNIDARLTGADPWAGWRRHATSLGPALERLAALEAG